MELVADRNGKRTRWTRRGLLGRGAAVAGAAGASLALAACGSFGGGNAGRNAQKQIAAVSGTVIWQARDPASYRSVADWATGEFRKRFPNITVEIQQDTTGNFDKTIATLVGGAGPDIINGWGRLMVQYAAKGLTVNHNELTREFKQADVGDFVKSQWDGLVIPTTNFRLGIPIYVNLFMLFYNKSLLLQRGLKEPDDTWDHSIYSAALKTLTYEEAGGKKVWGGFANVTVPDRQYHVKAYGGHYVNPKDLTKTMLDQVPAQQALQWIHDRLWLDKTWAPLDAARRTWTPNSQQDGFGQGVLATFEDGMDKVAPVAQRMALGSDWNVAPIPRGPVARNTLITTDAHALWRNSKVKDAAWEFMKFLSSREFYEQQATSELLIPPRRSSFDAWVNAVKQKLGSSGQAFAFKAIQEAMSYATVDEVFLCQNEAERVLNDAVGAVFVRGERPPTYLRDVAAQVNQAAGSCGAKLS
jgi:multiple sugar transport system substrate-binding protein